MKNYYPRTLVVTMACAALASASLFAFQSASAYGYMKEMKGGSGGVGRGHLIFKIATAKQLTFCVKIDSTVTDRFHADAIAIQTEKALNVWLHAIPEITKKHIDVKQVDCKSVAPDVEVDVGPERNYTALASYQRIQNDGWPRSHSLIKINSDWRYPFNGEDYGIFDFGYLDKKAAGGSLMYQEYMDLGLANNLTAAGLLARLKQAGIKEFIDEVQLRFSTWPIILHELGHSFGLCDLDERMSASCAESTFTIETQPDCVMKSSGIFYLAEDDVRGLSALYRDYGIAGSKTRQHDHN